MKIKQDQDTGKILIELENCEKFDNFANFAEDYVSGLTEVISNNIGPEVVRLGKNLDKTIQIVIQQQSIIKILSKAINFLIDEDDAKYRLETQAKLRKELVNEFKGLEKILESK